MKLLQLGQVLSILILAIVVPLAIFLGPSLAFSHVDSETTTLGFLYIAVGLVAIGLLVFLVRNLLRKESNNLIR